MYDTTERVRRVKQTALRLIQKRERTALRRLGTLCTALALGLTGALAHFHRRGTRRRRPGGLRRDAAGGQRRRLCAGGCGVLYGRRCPDGGLYAPA